MTRRSSALEVLCGEGWNLLTHMGLPEAKASSEGLLVGHGLKLGDQQRLDTVLVPTTNFADWPCASVRGLGESIVFEFLGEYARKC